MIADETGESYAMPLDFTISASPSDLEWWTPEEREFIERRGIMPLVKRAIELAQAHFESSRIAVYISGDPESGAQWIVVRSTTSASVDNTLKAYGKLKRQWLKEAPDGDPSLVRFTYHIAWVA
jgi:hypothetical protein